MTVPTLKVSTTKLWNASADAVVILLFEGAARLPAAAAELDRKLDGALADARRLKDFRGERGEVHVLHRPAGVKARRVVLLGLGAKTRKDREAVRRAGHMAAKTLAPLRLRSWVIEAGALEATGLGLDQAAACFAEGVGLATYEYRGKKKKSATDAAARFVRSVTVHAGGAALARDIRRELARARVLIESVHEARDLGNAPANLMDPSGLASHARRIARETGCKVTILGEREMRKLRMGGILGVSQGSAKEARLIVLEHRPRGAKCTLGLVGKGVTFDSGGISLKPWKPMWDMKYDMCGAAAVLAAFRALVKLSCAHRVVAIVGATENLPDGKAYKPGDVVVAHGGKSIEIHSTDAEGRVVLADALSYISRWKPDAVVDVATLTGAVVTALGKYCAAVMGNSDKLARELRAAGERTGDRLWQLPLWDEYGEAMKSQVADVCNTGDGRGGSIQGGWFLEQFTSYDWCHLDIAGTAWLDSETGTHPRGASGFGARLLADFALNWKAGSTA